MLATGCSSNGKFFGVPDGGVLATSRIDAIRRQPLEPPPTEWWKAAFAATQMRSEFDLVGAETRWFLLFRQVEETFPVGYCCSSDIARMLIETGTDYGFMKTARRENYLALAAHFKRICAISGSGLRIQFSWAFQFVLMRRSEMQF